MGKHLGLVQQCGGRNMRNHEAGGDAGVRARERPAALVDVGVDEPVDTPFADAHQIGKRNRSIVERQCQRRSVEIAAGKNLAGPLTGEDQRIVRGRSRLDLDHLARMLAVRRAPHHAPAACSAGNRRPALADHFPVRLANLAVAQQLTQMRGCLHLPGMWPCLVNARIEGRRRAAQSLERHGAGQIEQPVHADRAEHGQTADCCHRLRAIQQRQAFLGFEHQGSETSLGECRLGRQPAPSRKLPLPQ